MSRSTVRRGGASSFDRVKAHMTSPFKEDLARRKNLEEISDDLEVMLRRFGRVRALADEHGRIEMSPYMRSLLKMAGRHRTEQAEPAREAAGL